MRGIKALIASLPTIRRLWGYIWKHGRFSLIGLTALKLIEGVIPAAQIYVTTKLIDTIVRAINDSSTYLKQAILLIAIQALMQVSMSIIRSYNKWLLSKMQMQMKYRFECDLAEKSSRLPLAQFDKPNMYNQLQLAHTSEQAFNLFQTLLGIGQSVAGFVSYFIFLLGIHWAVALTVCLASVPSIMLNIRYGAQYYMQFRDQTPSSRMKQYLFELLVGRESAKEIRIFGLADHLLSRWKQIYSKNTKEFFELEKKMLLSVGAVDSFSNLVGFGLSISLLLACVRGVFSIGQFVASLQTLSAALSTLQQLCMQISFLPRYILMAKDIFIFMDLPEEVRKDSGRPFPLPLRNGIEINNLSFTYEGMPYPQIRNITFRINPGEKIAIVGNNGAGKSTLAKCLLGLYTPTHGTISFDGINITDFHPPDFRSQVTAVFQDFMRFQFSVRENIGFGNVACLHDDAYIQVAASRTGADEVARTLSKGYDTVLGYMFEGAEDLSYGQWQKVALARAVNRNAQLILLDEPTSAMDPMAEAEMLEQFIRVMEGKTTILISHRLGICKSVDRIIVLQNGEMVEQGSHVELMAERGVYSEMYETQAKWYEN